MTRCPPGTPARGSGVAAETRRTATRGIEVRATIFGRRTLLLPAVGRRPYSDAHGPRRRRRAPSGATALGTGCAAGVRAGQARGGAGRPDDVQGLVQREPLPATARRAARGRARGGDHQPLPGHVRHRARPGARSSTSACPRSAWRPAPGVSACSVSSMAAACGPGDEVVYAWRSFEAYPIVVQVSGATPVPVPLTPDGRHDLPAMADAVTERTRVVLVCSPNNPTGPAVHADELESFLDRVPSDVLVVLDEAYVEFVRDPRVPDALESAAGPAQRRGAADLLEGLRVGRAAGRFRRRLAAGRRALRKTAVPFGVSGVAQQAAVASLARPPSWPSGSRRSSRSVPAWSPSSPRRVAAARHAGELRLVRGRRQDARADRRLRRGGPGRAPVRHRRHPGHHRRGGGQRPDAAGRRGVSRRTPLLRGAVASGGATPD